MDNLELKIWNIELNVMKRDVSVRKIVFLFAWIIFGLWMILGWDSSQSQFEFVVVELPNFFKGKVSFSDLAFIYNDQYGKGMHYSAWVIYGLMCWGLMKYYDKKLDLHGCRNFGLAFSFVLLSIGFFETFWHYGFALNQGQLWVIQWKFPQIKILIQCFSFFFLGGLMIVVMHLNENRLYFLGKWKVWDKIKPFKIPYPSRRGHLYYTKPKTNFPQYRLNFDKWTGLLIVLSLSSVFVWFRYGDFFPVETLSVEVKGYGTWTNSKYFPQTVYTIETDLTDNINAGDQFFVENDLLHGVNTLCKVFLTMLSYNIGKVRKVKGHSYD